MTIEKRSRKKPTTTVFHKPQADDPVDRQNDLRHSERAHRLMAERGTRMYLAALARSAFRHGILLNGMTPEQQIEAARGDGWGEAIVGAERWAGGRRPAVVRISP